MDVVGKNKVFRGFFNDILVEIPINALSIELVKVRLSFAFLAKQ